ncbi:MAG: sigma-70 family RNA polymerase sigma factor [Odoribacteraceae bacterium]|jgi:RNA polymerase sigma factor (sigma-70 family)|nr:sigma-70 family RNA polymerase sigma factor [Odoribacteraceae bacterium]
MSFSEKQASEREMEFLFRRYYRPLVVFANNYVHRLDEAEDIVQEQFMKLWSGGRLERVAAGAESTFLFIVIKNACINFLEKKKVPLTGLDLPHYRIAEREAETLDEETAAAILDALHGLPERMQQVVERVVILEESYREAAEELGISVNTVKTLLRLGLRALREQLKDHAALFLLHLLACRKGNLLNLLPR